MRIKGRKEKHGKEKGVTGPTGRPGKSARQRNVAYRYFALFRGKRDNGGKNGKKRGALARRIKGRKDKHGRRRVWGAVLRPVLRGKNEKGGKKRERSALLARRIKGRSNKRDREAVVAGGSSGRPGWPSGQKCAKTQCSISFGYDLAFCCVSRTTTKLGQERKKRGALVRRIKERKDKHGKEAGVWGGA